MKLSEINNRFESYQQLISVCQKYKDEVFSDIHIELDGWFAANMSAALGAILDVFANNLNFIHIDKITSPKTEQILLKNDFLTYYGRNRAVDTNHTTIRFQKLKPTDGLFFKNYVIEELIGRLPSMSQALKEKITEGIYEIFVNAQCHSATTNIYTCGQFYPIKNKIEFTVVDTGVGFKNKINTRFGSTLNAAQAIRWATKDRNTTKEDITGGIGLAILKEFIEKNKGKMQIISNDGFYEFAEHGDNLKLFHGEFPGTIVNLEFCTDDTNNYSLRSETDINDIF